MIHDIESIDELDKRLKRLMISEKQFAELIDYSPDAIRKWRKNGKIPKWVKYPLAYLSFIRDSEETAKLLGISKDAPVC